MENFFSIYDALLGSMGRDAESITVNEAMVGQRWAMASAGGHFGIAMAEHSDSIPPVYKNGLGGLTLAEGAKAAKSWNLAEAAMGHAVLNAYFNTPTRLESLQCAEPFENYSTAGLSFRGMTVGVIGHLRLTPQIHAEAKEVLIIERDPQPGDYPDAACDYILPRCDAVFITGSALVNKTLPHLLELCRGAYTILTGPSVPMCPALLDFGIDRLAGLVVTDAAEMRSRVVSGVRGSPYPWGQSFLLKK